MFQGSGKIVRHLYHRPDRRPKHRQGPEHPCRGGRQHTCHQNSQNRGAGQNMSHKNNQANQQQNMSHKTKNHVIINSPKKGSYSGTNVDRIVSSKSPEPNQVSASHLENVDTVPIHGRHRHRPCSVRFLFAVLQSDVSYKTTKYRELDGQGVVVFIAAEVRRVLRQIYKAFDVTFVQLRGDS